MLLIFDVTVPLKLKYELCREFPFYKKKKHTTKYFKVVESLVNRKLPQKSSNENKRSLQCMRVTRKGLICQYVPPASY